MEVSREAELIMAELLAAGHREYFPGGMGLFEGRWVFSKALESDLGYVFLYCNPRRGWRIRVFPMKGRGSSWSMRAYPTSEEALSGYVTWWRARGSH